MNNEIKKMIYSLNENKLSGIIVIRNNSIKKYGYGEISQNSLNKKYSEIISELKKQYEKEVEGLTEQEAVDKLYQLNKLVKINADLMTKIIMYYDNENPTKFEIINTKSKDIVKIEDCYDTDDFFTKYRNALVKLCKTYDIKLNSIEDLDNDEFILYLTNIGLIEDKDISKDLNTENNSNSDNYNESNDTDNSLNSVITVSKIKNFVMNHKFVSALLLGGTILLISRIPGCSKQNTKNETKASVTPEPIAIEPTLEPTPEPTMNPIVEISEYKEIEFEGENNIFTYYSEPESNDLLIREINGNDYYDAPYARMQSLRAKNMYNIGNYIQSDIKFDDIGKYIYFENLFNTCDIKDKAFVKYFSMMSNEIIRNAYVENDFIDVSNYSKLSGLEFIKLIRDDEPLHVYIYGSEEYIYFSELSKEAKEIVLEIASLNNIPLCKDTVGYYSETLDQDYINDVILSKAEELGMIK